MNKTTVHTTPSDDSTAHEAEVDYYLAEMKRVQQQRQEDRQVIQTLQAETHATLSDIMQTLRAA